MDSIDTVCDPIAAKGLLVWTSLVLIKIPQTIAVTKVVHNGLGSISRLCQVQTMQASLSW